MPFVRTPGVTFQKIQSGQVLRPKPLGEPEKCPDSDVTSRKRKREAKDDKESRSQKKSREVEARGRLAPTEIPANSTVLGVVSKISKDAIVVDLLCGHVGVCRVAACAPVLATYRIGDFVCGTVIRDNQAYKSENGNRNSERGMLPLSLAPADFNIGFSWARPPARNQIVLLTVTSIEDHGLSASFGTSISTQDGIKTYVQIPPNKKPSDYEVNQVIMAVVDEIKKASKLIICKTGDAMASRYLSFGATNEISSLRAGQLVECKIDTVIEVMGKTEKSLPFKKKLSSIEKCLPSKNVLALEMRLCQTLPAIVAKEHLHHPLMQVPGKLRFPYISKKSETKEKETKDQSWPKRCKRFNTGDVCLARIAAVVPHKDEFHIFLSLLDHVVWLYLPSDHENLLKSADLSKLYTDMRVVETQEKAGVGLFVPITTKSKWSIPEEEMIQKSDFEEWKFSSINWSMGWCPKRYVADETPEFKISQLQIGQKVDGKILGSNLLDAKLKVTLNPIYLSEKYCTFADVHIGEEVRGEIVKQMTWGYVVKLSKFLTAKVVKEMLTDKPSEKVDGKFKVGVKSKFRVLAIDPNARTVFLTCKKSLMNISETEVALHLTPACQLSPETINEIFNLFVYKIRDHGFIVKGFGSFFGWLSFNEVRMYLEKPDMPDSDIATLRRFAPGTSLKVRLTAIRKANSNNDLTRKAETRLLFSLDLDKISVFEKDVWSIDVCPMPARFQTSYPLPFDYTLDDDASEIASRVLKLISVGSEVPGKVVNIFPLAQSLTVAILGKLQVWIHATETAGQLKGFPLRNYKLRDQVSVIITGIADKPFLKLDPLVLLKGSLRSPDDKVLPRAISDLMMGEKYTGIVQRMCKFGLFVALSPEVVVRIKLRDLWLKKVDLTVEIRHDLDQLVKLFPVGKVVKRVRILTVSLSKKEAEATLQPEEDLVPRGQITFESIEVGQNLPATVKRIETFGIFVTLADSEGLDCLCPTAEIADETSFAPKLEKGDLVLVHVLTKDQQRRRVTVGLKASYFEDMDMSDEVFEPKTNTMVVNDIDDDEKSTTHSTESDCSSASESGEQEIVSEEEASLNQKSSDSDQERSDLLPREMVKGLRIDKSLLAEESSPSFEEVLRREMKEKHKNSVPTTQAPTDMTEDYKDLKKAERRGFDGEAKSVDDFERLLITQGHDSHTWIQYMSYYARLSDFANARRVAQRGIESMTFENGDERMNLWIAWINLEASFGSTEQLMEIYERAVQYSDPMRVHNHMIDLFEERKEWESVDNVLDRMIRKHGEHLDVWIRSMTCLYSRDAKKCVFPESHRNLSTRDQIDVLLRRSTSKLSQQHHLNLRVLVARLEFKYVSTESGRSLFYSLLASHPKRLDIWSIFLDSQSSALKNLQNGKKKELKLEVAAMREIFKKLYAIDFKEHKMKAIFKRWLKFEQQYGSDAEILEIRKRAKEYVLRRE